MRLFGLAKLDLCDNRTGFGFVFAMHIARSKSVVFVPITCVAPIFSSHGIVTYWNSDTSFLNVIRHSFTKNITGTKIF